MIRPKKIFVFLFVCAFIAFVAGVQNGAGAQTSLTAAQGLVLAQSALVALTHGVGVSDVTLTGTARRIAGSDDETGPITLKARGASESSVNMSFGSGARSEVRNAANDSLQGQWTGPNGVAHAISGHNLMTDSAWFFPALSVLSRLSTPNLSITYLGEETRQDVAVHHLHFVQQYPNSASADFRPLQEALTATDIYLDASTLLPVAIAFNAHPDNDMLRSIPVEVDFSDWRTVQGVAVPFRIQKLFNGTLILDVTVESAVVNSGLNDASFAIQ